MATAAKGPLRRAYRGPLVRSNAGRNLPPPRDLRDRGDNAIVATVNSEANGGIAPYQVNALEQDYYSCGMHDDRAGGVFSCSDRAQKITGPWGW